MNLVSHSCTPSEGVVLITTTGREYRITPQMLRAAYLAAEGDESARKQAAITACRAVRGILRPKPDHLFATHRHGRLVRDKAAEAKEIDKDEKRPKHERDADSDAESPFLDPAAGITFDFDPATGEPRDFLRSPG